MTKTSIYAWHVTGKDVHGRDWTTRGQISCGPGDFHDAVEHALKQTFLQLTSGKAVYGSPGLGCKGPYRMSHFEITEVEDERRTDGV